MKKGVRLRERPPGDNGSPGDAADPADQARVPPEADEDQTRSAGYSDRRTRDRLAELLLQHGDATVADLSEELGLSAAGIRRHLDAMLSDGVVDCRLRPAAPRRGRGRPAKAFALTEAGRSRFHHTYDDLAAAALRWIAQIGGQSAVSDFAADQVSALEDRCKAAMAQAGDDPVARAAALARALTAEGYAAAASVIASGGQLCQHHCPVAHVAAEFPQLCEAETHVISRLVGSHVQRLATIANGDRVCTTHIPGAANTQPARSPAPPVSALHTSATPNDRGVSRATPAPVQTVRTHT